MTAEALLARVATILPRLVPLPLADMCGQAVVTATADTVVDALKTLRDDHVNTK